MKLFADENVDRPIVDRLRQDGHLVEYVAEISPSVADDEGIDKTNAQNSLFLTSDKDFGELIFRQHRVISGVVLLRLLGISAALKADLVTQAFREHGDQMPGAFTVISPGMVRIRQSL